MGPTSHIGGTDGTDQRLCAAGIEVARMPIAQWSHRKSSTTQAWQVVYPGHTKAVTRPGAVHGCNSRLVDCWNFRNVVPPFWPKQ